MTRPVIDYTGRDYDSLLRSMRAFAVQRFAGWDPANEADVGNVLLELFAHVGDVLAYYTDRVATESFLGTARSRASVIQHLSLIGYRLGTAAPAAALLTLSVPEAVQDTVTVRRGDAFATKSGRGAPSIRFEYTRAAPLVIDFSAVPAGAADHRRVVTGIPVEEGRLFTDEFVGVGDGTPDQRFPVVHTGVMLRPGVADVAVRGTVAGGPPGDWTLVDTLAFSGAQDRRFVVDIDAADGATLVFGDGTFGAVPRAGERLTATYRTGGGRAGNVAAGTILSIVDAPELSLVGATVTNPAAANGGADRESVEHAVEHAPAVFRSLRRAVTAADYEALARDFKGVGKVRATPSGWNRVILRVAPAGGGKVNDVLEAGLLAYFEDKRMLSQVIEIQDVDYVPIVVTAGITVRSYAVPADVVTAVREAGAGMFAEDAVDFGQALFLSRFYELFQQVPGVESVTITEFRRTGAADLVERTGRILLSPDEIPVDGGLTVTVVTGAV
ncbi:hypothetical protein Adu01nite_70140 [Paractinoplanes durhamensis]|uniref:Baseplate protein J-like domain-containing protein n=1 Tax=Paractinoplanes durhamensis TaxID=113563 RepID=A0ABQ3Z758_9ACTN|nr:baseplate J/gp47 family protein [Actinoplanes durhamensis]GIE05664.1 hypothetical protein Adu01nite_70140 [Actinoplanes durhamensis]